VLDVILTDSVECGIICELFTSLSLHQALVGQTQLHKACAEESLKDGAPVKLMCSPVQVGPYAKSDEVALDDLAMKLSNSWCWQALR